MKGNIVDESGASHKLATHNLMVSENHPNHQVKREMASHHFRESAITGPLATTPMDQPRKKRCSLGLSRQ